MPADLLFEIGCEEIPAKMLSRALADLPGAVKARLDGARLEHKSIKALGTPRRLAVIVKGLAERQPDLREEVVGPPVSAAFAPDGSLTKAGQGFAAKNGVDASQIAKKEVPGKKGLYAVARRHIAGTETRALLPDLLRELASSIPWPKGMRWGWSETAFVRAERDAPGLDAQAHERAERAVHAGGREQEQRAVVLARQPEQAALEREVMAHHDRGEIEHHEAEAARAQQQLRGLPEALRAGVLGRLHDRERIEVDAARGEVRRIERAALQLHPGRGLALAAAARVAHERHHEQRHPADPEAHGKPPAEGPLAHSAPLPRPDPAAARTHSTEPARLTRVRAPPHAAPQASSHC